MNILERTSNVIQYLYEAVAWAFSPIDDTYPAIGIQPFEGEPYSQWAD